MGRRESEPPPLATAAIDVRPELLAEVRDRGLKKALTFEVRGLGGRKLNSEWEREAVSYKGIAVSGYPNYFKVNGPNTGSGHSSQISYMEAATDYIVQAICAVKRDKSIKAIDARRDMQDAYVAGMRRKMQTKKN